MWNVQQKVNEQKCACLFMTMHCLVHADYSVNKHSKQAFAKQKKNRFLKCFPTVSSRIKEVFVSLTHQLCSMIIPIWCEVCMLLVILISFAQYVATHQTLRCIQDIAACTFFLFIKSVIDRGHFCHSLLKSKFIILQIVYHSWMFQNMFLCTNFIPI